MAGLPAYSLGKQGVRDAMFLPLQVRNPNPHSIFQSIILKKISFAIPFLKLTGSTFYDNLTMNCMLAFKVHLQILAGQSGSYGICLSTQFSSRLPKAG
jgi:hypothetical protein